MNASNEQDKLTSQWITSLAISVVCCAALFLVFAGYIIDLHGKTSDTAIRLEVLQERQNQLVAELNAMRRPIPVMSMNPVAPVQAELQPAPQPLVQDVAPAPQPPVVVAPSPKPLPAPVPAPSKAAPAKPPVNKR
jgi:hypothetical protein